MVIADTKESWQAKSILYKPVRVSWLIPNTVHEINIYLSWWLPQKRFC